MPENCRQGEGEYEKRAAFSGVAKSGTCAGDLSNLASQQWHLPGDERDLSFGSRIPDPGGHCGGVRCTAFCLAPPRLYQGARGAAQCICLCSGGSRASSLRAGKSYSGDLWASCCCLWLVRPITISWASHLPMLTLPSAPLSVWHAPCSWQRLSRRCRPPRRFVRQSLSMPLSPCRSFCFCGAR